MAPNDDNGLPQPSPSPQPGEKTLHVWAKPIEGENAADAATPSNQRPTISEAISTIKKEDFANIANTPCARQGLLTGIAAGAGVGGLKFVFRGNATKAANWAVGFFLLGSVASFEYCQYLRRVERMQMKRHIEVVTENRRDQAKKMVEERKEQLRLQEEKKAAERPWYKFW